MCKNLNGWESKALTQYNWKACITVVSAWSAILYINKYTVNIGDMNLVITVPAHDKARPSAGTVMNTKLEYFLPTLLARFMGPTWGPPGADRTQVGPMLAPWSLLSGKFQLLFTIMISKCIFSEHMTPFNAAEEISRNLVALQVLVWTNDMWVTK